MLSSKAAARSSEGSKIKDSSELGLNPLVMEQMKLFLKDVVIESLISNPHTLDLLSTSWTVQVKRKAHTVDHDILLSEEKLSAEPSRAKVPRRQNLPSHTVVVAPSDSEEEDIIEFAIDEQAIDDLLWDHSVLEPEKIGSTSSPNSWLVRKKLDRKWPTIWQTLSERC